MAELVLVNPNVTQPAVGPLGLEYVAEACRRAGQEVEVLDLCFAEDPAEVLRRRLAQADPQLVGLTLRNTDNCYLLSSHSFIPALADLVATIRAATEAPLVLGGAGFSVAPAAVMRAVGAEYGVRGDGERVLPLLLEALRGPGDAAALPGLLWRRGDEILANEPEWADLADEPALQRDLVDNPQYFHRGGQLGVETKRGCDRACIYCADPLSKGRRLRLRSPRAVAQEIENLLGQGCDVYHLCDSEFNLPEEHARAVCEELICRGLGGKIRWYAYLSPRPFSRGLAELMRRAGCAGLNFGADSGSDTMLARLGRDYRGEQVQEAVRLCREQDLPVMVDLLVGGPGETPQSVAESVALVQAADPSCVGLSLGVRVYPDTPLARWLAGPGAASAQAARWGQTEDNPDLLRPVFYLSPDLGSPSEAAAHLSELIGGDERFFFGGSGDESDYDYDDNQALVEAIAAGARGAYWDILRQLRGRS